jgi:hypothetical protein
MGGGGLANDSDSSINAYKRRKLPLAAIHAHSIADPCRMIIRRTISIAEKATQCIK